MDSGPALALAPPPGSVLDIESMIGLSPSGLGRFRVVFGVALLGALLLNPLPELALARDLHRYSELSDWAWAHWLAEHPFPGTITFVTAVALLTFASGVWPRTAFLASAITLTVYVMTLLQYGSEHDWGLPLVVLWGLTLAPWHSTGKGTGTEGFAIWLPGFALGLAWLKRFSDSPCTD